MHSAFVQFTWFFQVILMNLRVKNEKEGIGGRDTDGECDEKYHYLMEFNFSKKYNHNDT